MGSIAIVDYGMGNLRSVAKAVERVAGNTKVLITHRPDEIRRADRIVLPGQGAAGECMAALKRHGLEEDIKHVSNSRPLLGICMGMQVLLSHSAENGGVDCLGLFSGDVRPFMDKLDTQVLKVPHMGWNKVFQSQPHTLWHKIEDGARFYFVHSYYVQTDSEDMALGYAHYGIPFVAAVGCDNIFAIQCHPEKSAENGLQLLKNFVEWTI